MGEQESGLSDEEVVNLFHSIQQQAAGGMSREAICQQFTASGMPEAEAKELVDTALRPDMQIPSGGGGHDHGGGGGSGFPSWLIWVGVLLGINLLSFMLDLGFWIY